MGYLEEAGAEHPDPDGVFGVPLESIQRVDSSGIPLVVLACTAVVEKYGIDAVGIYRLSASKTKVDELRKILAVGHYDDIATVEKWDINTISCVFKQWLRELPTPLCTFEQFDAFTDLATRPSILGFKGLVARLPPQHRVVLCHVLRHLKKIASRKQVNMMQESNLGAIFGPSLLRPDSTHSFQVSKQNTAVEFMIDHVSEIFGV